MRLIDADALQRRICGAKCGCEYEDCGSEGDCGYDHFIFHAPTIDPASLHIKDGIILTENELQDKLNDAFDLGYQACLNYKGLTWKEAEELQRYRENPASLRPKGEWVQVICHVESDDGFIARLYECCSRCHEPNGRRTSDFCPNCGTDMRGSL